MIRPPKRLGIIAYVLIFGGLSFFNKIITLITDYAWFKEVHLLSVFKVTFFSMWGWGLACGILTGLLVYLNLQWARRNSRHDLG